MGRHDRHDHSRGSADPAGHHLHFDRRPQPHGHVAGILPRPLEVRQPRAGQQYLPLLCGYGDDGHTRHGRKEPVEELPQGNHHRFAGHGLHLRAGHLLAGLHHSRKGHQPDAVAAGGLRQLFPLPAYVVGRPDYRHRPDVRRAGGRADMGRRSFEGYFRRGQGGLSASVLPEDQQKRRAEKHPADSGLRRDAAGAAVRGDAFGAVVLPDSVAAHRAAVPDHVYAHVLGRHRPAIQDEEHRPSVPSGQGQRADVVPRLSGFLRRPAGVRTELRAAQPDLDRKQHRMVLGADYRLRGGRRRAVRHLCTAQTLVERPACPTAK